MKRMLVLSGYLIGLIILVAIFVYANFFAYQPIKPEFQYSYSYNVKNGDAIYIIDDGVRLRSRAKAFPKFEINGKKLICTCAFSGCYKIGGSKYSDPIDFINIISIKESYCVVTSLQYRQSKERIFIASEESVSYALRHMEYDQHYKESLIFGWNFSIFFLLWAWGYFLFSFMKNKRIY